MTGRGVDAFEVLGLPYDPDLTDVEVREAYRLWLWATHPDNGHPRGHGGPPRPWGRRRVD